MSTEQSVELQQSFGAAINEGHLERMRDLVATDCVDHDPAPGQQPGALGYIKFFTEMRTAFPDLHVEVEHLVAAADDVAFAYTLTGTHEGPFQGHAATGRRVEVRGLQISRFANGLMVERWGSTDELGILSQLGVAAEPA